MYFYLIPFFAIQNLPSLSLVKINNPRTHVYVDASWRKRAGTSGCVYNLPIDLLMELYGVIEVSEFFCLLG